MEKKKIRKSSLCPSLCSFLFLLFSFFFLPFNTWAKMEKYVINRDHSEISFSTDFMAVSKVSGQFQQFQGQFLYDPAENLFQDLSIELSVQSIFTNNKMRDGHLRRSDFLDADHHPLIIFQTPLGKTFPLSLNKEVPSEVPGLLTMKGVTKPVTFKVSFLGRGKDTWKRENFFFHFQGKINRQDFNLLWNKPMEQGQFLIGEEIEIEGHVQVQIADSKTAASRFLIPDTKGIRLRELYNQGGMDKKPYKTIELPPEGAETEEGVVQKGGEQVQGPSETSNPNQKLDQKPDQKPNQKFNQGPTQGEKVFSFFVLGFFGFIGSILTGVYARVGLNKFFKGRGKTEDSKVFTFTDTFTFFLIILLTYAFAYAYRVVFAF